MFKKTFALITTVIMIFIFAACTQTAASEAKQASATQTTNYSASAGEETETAAGKILVVYFSWSGNTEEMASYIAEQTNGDLLKLEPKSAYPSDYSETGDVAKAERDGNARPKIVNLPSSVDEYDKILVGYPIWWHTAPMIIGTFLENYDLTEKAIYPFSQSASMDTGQFDQSVEFVRKASAGAIVYDGLFTGPSDKAAIDAYLSDNELVK